MLNNPYNVVRDFEAELCRYTGAPYAVTVNSCSMALLLAVAWHIHSRKWKEAWPDGQVVQAVEIPKRTYVSVPMSIIHAGGRPTFRDEEWLGAYQLKPLPVWDSARWFTNQLFYTVANKPVVGTDQSGVRKQALVFVGGMVCVSFHASKTLGDSQGGAILHDNPEADAWLRRARFDGRTEGVAPKDDDFRQVGYHAYMSPDVAARLLHKLSVLPRHNEPLPNDDYPDLSHMEIFKC